MRQVALNMNYSFFALRCVLRVFAVILVNKTSVPLHLCGCIIYVDNFYRGVAGIMHLVIINNEE